MLGLLAWLDSGSGVAAITPVGRLLLQTEAYLAIDGDLVSANVLVARLMDSRKAVHKVGEPPPQPSERKVRLVLKALLGNGRRR